MAGLTPFASKHCRPVVGIEKAAVMHRSSPLMPAMIRVYDLIYGLILPLLFLLSMLFSAHAGLGFLKNYQGQTKRTNNQVSQAARTKYPERSLFQDNERYDVLAVYEGNQALDRQVMIRQASSGQVKLYRIGDRIFGKGPFVATVETDRVLFWSDGRTRKIPMKP